MSEDHGEMSVEPVVNRMRHWLAAGFVLAVALLATARAQELAKNEAGSGSELAARLRETRPDRTMTNRATLKIRGRDGRKQVPLTVITTPGEDSWTVRYIVGDESAPSEILTVHHSTRKSPEYSYQSGSNAPVSGPDLVSRSLAGSDFAFGDLGLEFLHWPRQRLVDRGLSNGRMCQILESVSSATNGPASVRTWIDEKQGVILSAEAYDSRQVRTKYFSVSNFREVDDQWTFSLSIVDDRKGTKTELSYEPK
jgi:hypothetical protein